MLVRFLQPTAYTPKKADSTRCYGQLRLRPTTTVQPVTVEVDCVNADGTRGTQRIETTRNVCGPMEHFFPKGATPDLDPSVAADFVAAGLAEVIDETSVARQVSKDEILIDVKVD